MKYIFYIFLVLKMISCNDRADVTEDKTSIKSADSGQISKAVVDETPVADNASCYMKIHGRDTAIVMFEQNGTELSGKMLYDNFEKDGSRGVVKGKEDGNILKLWYDFQSEGIRSVMEVYFKKDNGRLLRGVGDMDVKTDTTYFRSGINYSDMEAFSKVDCKLINWKFY
jgi:hypothetical protein